MTNITSLPGGCGLPLLNPLGWPRALHPTVRGVAARRSPIGALGDPEKKMHRNIKETNKNRLTIKKAPLRP